MAVQKLRSPDYASPGDVRVLWEEAVEYEEPVIDRLLWQTERMLSVLIQNGQPPHDGKAPPRAEPVYIVD